MQTVEIRDIVYKSEIHLILLFLSYCDSFCCVWFVYMQATASAQQKENMSSEKRPFVPKTPMDFQKLKLERLMANPDKQVVIPETSREKKGFTVPEFVRNVMGSSAGAGSGEFHVYRHLRRKEYTRQKMIEEKGEQEKLDEEYFQRIEENKRNREAKTAKKRAKRLKRKEKVKQFKLNKGAVKKSNQQENKSESEEDSSEEDESDHQQSVPEGDQCNQSPKSDVKQSPQKEEA